MKRNTIIIVVVAVTVIRMICHRLSLLNHRAKRYTCNNHYLPILSPRRPPTDLYAVCRSRVVRCLYAGLHFVRNIPGASQNLTLHPPVGSVKLCRIFYCFAAIHLLLRCPFPSPPLDRETKQQKIGLQFVERLYGALRSLFIREANISMAVVGLLLRFIFQSYR